MFNKWEPETENTRQNISFLQYTHWLFLANQNLPLPTLLQHRTLPRQVYRKLAESSQFPILKQQISIQFYNVQTQTRSGQGPPILQTQYVYFPQTLHLMAC